MISDQRRRMYPEVTGYYLPTLLDIEAYDEAAAAVDALISVQREDGAFGLGANVFVFDTAMVVRGLVHMVRSGRSGKSSSIDRVRDSLRAACSWLAAPEQRPASNGGRWTVPGNDMWSLPEKRGRAPEGIHLLGIVPLRMCGEVLGVQHFVDVSHQLQGLYLRDEQLLREIITFERRYQLTHFFAYIQEALQELGEDALVRLGMGRVQRYQRSDGSVPAYFDAEWSCSTGLAQLAMVWYKMGDVKSLRRADAALTYLLREMQDPASGGFLGSRGIGAAYFPQQQISWAVKYTLDALQALISAHFTRTVDRYPTAVDAHDGRLVALNHLLPEHTTVSDGVFDVLEVGCGKGRFAASFGENLPRNLSTRIVGTDISLGMLQFARRRIDAVAQAPATNLPFPPASFDAVFSVETLEHVLRVNATITEMSRVLAPRGKLCIVDKTSDDPQRRHQNWQLESWERWFGGSELAGVLKFAGGLSDITVRPVGYDRVGGTGDGLFLAWCGSKMPVPT